MLRLGTKHVPTAKHLLLHALDCRVPLHGVIQRCLLPLGNWYGLDLTVISATNEETSLCRFDSIPRFPESG